MNTLVAVPNHRQAFRWATARVLFYTYAGFCIFTVAGGFLTAPLFTWVFYGDWRFWQHVRSARRLWAHGCRMLLLVLLGRNGGFSFSVALTAPPTTAVDPARVQLSPHWDFGPACGPCTRCCSKHGCPILDGESGLCRGFDSFFWRYFNCGRFPSRQSEIDYYNCPKWELRHRPEQAPAAGREGWRILPTLPGLEASLQDCEQAPAPAHPHPSQ